MSQMNSQPIASLEVIQVQLEHVRAQGERMLALLEKTATREEVRDADASLRAQHARHEEEVKSLTARVRSLEDDRTERKGILWLMGAVVTVLGVPGLVLVLRALLATPT